MEDNETGEKLYNPFVKIQGAEHRIVYLNAKTFEPCHNHLIDPRDENSLRNREKIPIYHPVYAITAQFPQKIGKFVPPSLRKITDRIQSQNLIGYLDSELLKDSLPRCYSFLKTGKC